MTPEEKASIVSTYKAGETMAEIAERTGRSSNTILVVLRNAGVETRKPGRRSNSEQHDRIRALWKDGLDAAAIAREVGSSPTTVREIVKYVAGGPGFIATRHAEESVWRYEAGETVEQIAQSLHRSVNTISRWLKDAGVQVLSSIERRSPEEQREYALRGAEANRAKKRVVYRVCEWGPCDVEFPLRHSKDRRLYCSVEHAGLGRRDPSKRRTTTCRMCGAEIEGWANAAARAYCSRECWAKVSPDAAKVVVEDRQFDSSWEAFFWSMCQINKTPCERVDRERAVEWAPGRWYAPDFHLPTLQTYVEIKGLEDDEDPARWDLWREKYGRLLVLGERELNHMRHARDIERWLRGEHW